MLRGGDYGKGVVHNTSQIGGETTYNFLVTARLLMINNMLISFTQQLKGGSSPCPRLLFING